ITGEVLNDAAYDRNLEVMQLLNIDIVPYYQDYSQFYNIIVKDNAAGDCTYDIVTPWGGRSNANNLIIENQLYDWNKVPYVDFEADWYNQSANEAFTVLGKQFYCVSDILGYGRQGGYLFLFNKELFVDYGLEYPYQLVYDQKWTYDALRAYIKDTYNDLNGDGKKDAGDFFGISTHPIPLAVAIMNWGESPLKLNENGFVLNIFNNRIADMVDRLTELAQSPDVFYTETNIHDNFNAGRSLFEIYASDPKMLRELDFDFGYLPYPKYNEAQPDYIGIADGAAMGIPLSRSEEQVSRTGAIIEALSGASNKYMIDAFVKQYIENKVLRDEDSVNMYYIQRRGVIYELARAFDNTNLINPYFNYYVDILKSTNGSVNLASQYAKHADMLQASLDNLYEMILENQ
ncbi:MAG: hypothetical protein FWF15_10235, partial [Oscillospiraceae bacterium]|nr:hypothetical protein [Oscillospiraceae bacterium]